MSPSVLSFDSTEMGKELHDVELCCMNVNKMVIMMVSGRKMAYGVISLESQ